MKLSRFGIAALSASLLLTGWNSGADAQWYHYESDHVLQISDTSTYMGRSSIFASDSFVIEDMTVTLDIEHTWVGDLGIFLTSPHGFWMGIVGYPLDLTNTLSHRPVFGPNYGMEFVAGAGYTFTDSAAGGLPPEPDKATGPASWLIPGGNYLPEDSSGFLFSSIYAGENAQGYWHLDVFDNSITDGGRLISWSLDFNKPATVQSGPGIYFPAIYDGVDEWKNYITVQAADPSQPVAVTVTLYNPDGTIAAPNNLLCPTCKNPISTTILPYTKWNNTPNWALYQSLQQQLFEGSAVITSDKPVIAMTNSLGPNNEAFNIYEACTQATSELFFSKVFDGKVTGDGMKREWVSSIHVQNVNDVPVTVNIDINRTDGSLLGQLLNQVIPPHGKFAIRASDVTGVKPTSGTAKVTAVGGNIAGMVKYEYGTGMLSESFTLYEANQQSTLSYLPKIYDGYGGNKNYVTVLNKQSTNVNVTLDLYNEAGTLVLSHSQTLTPNEALNTTPTYLLCGSLGCTNFAGTAIVGASAPVYVATNTISPSTQDPREAFNIYEGCKAGQNFLFPKIYDGFKGWQNSVSIQNVDSISHTVNVAFYDSGGALFQTDVVSIPAHGQYNFSPMAATGAAFNTALKVSSDAPGSIAAAVRYERIDPINSLIRNLNIYEGIAQ